MAEPPPDLEYWTNFGYRKIGDVALVLAEVQEMLLRRGWESMALKVARVLDNLLTEVNALAVRTAVEVDVAIKAKIHATAAPNRPHTGQMETHIQSDPGPLGLVRIARISELDKIRNPEGRYGPFWRAQEEGTGSDGGVPSQVGRPLYGTFEPSGQPPRADARGSRGNDLAFFPGGRNPGLGRISVELPGRHFLRDGADEAGRAYVAALERLNGEYSQRLRALVVEVQKGRRSTTKVIHLTL